MRTKWHYDVFSYQSRWRGEFTALANTRPEVVDRTLPLFDIGRLTNDILQRKYLAGSRSPIETHLDRVAESIVRSWPFRRAMIDAYYWPPGALTENGDHVVAHMTRRLKEAGMPVVPLFGYAQWNNEVYQTSMRALNFAAESSYCLRLDRDAIEDAAEPEFFRANVEAILDSLDLFQSKCTVLIDFGDISATPIDDLIRDASRIIEQLVAFGFRNFITAGCSIPRTIDLAVKRPDSEGMIVRREAVLWKALRQEFRNITLVYGDFGVRGPHTNDGAHSTNTNGKIRHTIPQHSFVLRGHAFSKDGCADQMYDLAEKLVQSSHYLGPNFSWGDGQILACSRGQFKGTTTQWIAIDTNHHLAYVTQEAEEFELSVTAASPR